MKITMTRITKVNQMSADIRVGSHISTYGSVSGA